MPVMPVSPHPHRGGQTTGAAHHPSQRAAGRVFPVWARGARPRACTAYLMGNHVIAERIYRHDLAVMLHTRPGTAIYADKAGPAKARRWPAAHGLLPSAGEVSELHRRGERRRRAWTRAQTAASPLTCSKRPASGGRGAAGGPAGRAETHRVRGLRRIQQMVRMRGGAFET